MLERLEISIKSHKLAFKSNLLPLSITSIEITVYSHLISIELLHRNYCVTEHNKSPPSRPSEVFCTSSTSSSAAKPRHRRRMESIAISNQTLTLLSPWLMRAELVDSVNIEYIQFIVHLLFPVRSSTGRVEQSRAALPFNQTLTTMTSNGSGAKWGWVENKWIRTYAYARIRMARNACMCDTDKADDHHHPPLRNENADKTQTHEEWTQLYSGFASPGRGNN